MKIQDLSALVGGFLKILVDVFRLFINYFSKKFTKFNLFYEMFDYDYLSNEKVEKTDKNLKINSPNNKNVLSKISRINNIMNKFNDHNKFDLNKSNLHLNIQIMGVNDKNKTIFQNSPEPNVNHTRITKQEKTPSPDTNLSNLNYNINLYKNINFNSKDREINPSKLGILFLMKRIFCSCVYSNIEKQLNDILLRSEKYYNTRLDVVTYIRTLETIDKVKCLLFNENQNNSLNFIRKPHINDLEKLELNLYPYHKTSKITDIVEYYNDLLISNTFSTKDKQLLSFLIDDIQKLVTPYN